MIRLLVEIEADSSPLISCFVNLDAPASGYLSGIELKGRLASKRLGGPRSAQCVESLRKVQNYLKQPLSPGSRSVALSTRMS